MAEGGKEDIDRSVAIKEIESRVTKLNVNKISNIEPQNEEIRTFVIDCSQLFAKLYDSLTNSFTNDELRNFSNRIAEVQHTSTNRFLKDVAELSENRKILNHSLESGASKLDNNYLITTSGRLLVSLLEIIANLDSAFDKNISKYCVEEAYRYSNKLGFMSHLFFACVSVSAYLSFIPEFWDIVHSRRILRDLVKVSQKDMKSLERVKTSFQETEEMDEQVKELFFHGLDDSIVKDIDRIYREYDKCTKVFATVFISCLKTNHFITNDIKSLSEMFLFSRSELGEEWYDRTLRMNHPINFIEKKLDCREKLTALSKSAPDVSIDIVKILPDIEITTKFSNDSEDAGKRVIKLKVKCIPHLMLGVINTFSAYSFFRVLKDGGKHPSSDCLRMLSEKATTSLLQIEKYRKNIDKARGRPAINTPS